MKKISKRMKVIRKKICSTDIYKINEGIKILQKTATAKFNESIDVAIHLGINSKKSEQNIRNLVTLPHGIGRTIKIAVFTQGINAKIANESGATFVGMEDLVEKIIADKVKFDICIASPDAMPIVGKIGSILGPKGLMPNPKLGTVTSNISTAIHNAKQGQIRYKNDKNGIIHSTIGKVNFKTTQIKENFYALIESLRKIKPKQSKGVFFKKVSFSTTMGTSIIIDQSDLNTIAN